MDAILEKFYRESLRECQKDIEHLHERVRDAQGYGIEYDQKMDAYYVWDYNNTARIIYNAVSIEQANEFILNMAISKLMIS